MESGKPLSGDKCAGVDRPRGGGALGHGEGQLAVTGGHGTASSQASLINPCTTVEREEIVWSH